MAIESVRTNDRCESCVGFPSVATQPYGTHIYLNRRQKVNPLANGLNGSQFFNPQNSSNISNGSDCLFNSNDFNHLRKICKERGILYEDPHFVANNKAIFSKKESNPNKIWSSVQWMRPFQLVSRPKYITDYGPNRRFDVELGNGSNLFASNQPLFHATSIVYSMPRLFDRVISPLQTFNPSTYAGIWRFRFWRFGQWIEVLIDDRLPTFKGQLLFMQCTDASEFWAALLEKAYAKLHGSYDHYLRHCFVAQTTQDLTGGIAQSFTIGNHESHIIHQMIASAVPRSTLLSISINSSDNCQNRALRLTNGLFTRQSYLITGITRVRTLFDGIHAVYNFPRFPFNPNESLNTEIVESVLVRLKNVFGKGEWNGAWSERSFEWDHLSDRDREELTLRCRTEGEFWIPFDDLIINFTNLDLIHIGPDDWMQEISLHHKQPWRAVMARRKWKKGFNAGGSPSHSETFVSNPQFHIHIPKKGHNRLHVVVSITQFYDTEDHKGSQETVMKSIGFCVYEVPPSLTRLTATFVANNAPLDVTDFTVSRESVTFFTLPPGHFVIVTSTDKPHIETKFLLRIFTDESTHIWEVNDDNILFPIEQYMPKVIEAMIQNNGNNFLSRLISRNSGELDAFSLLKVLKVYYKCLDISSEKPSIELCHYLVMLNDPTITGRIAASGLTRLLNTVHFWQSVFVRHQLSNKNKIYTYHLRLILYEAGILVSNKVLESLLVRFAESSVHMSLNSFLSALVKLHLSHERFKSLERKFKQNDLTLEEMILLTIYS